MVTKDNNGTHIAAPTLYFKREETEANARLIAAAPELLAELQNIANADPRKWDEETRDQFQQWAQSRARFAIAKATGAAA